MAAASGSPSDSPRKRSATAATRRRPSSRAPPPGRAPPRPRAVRSRHARHRHRPARALSGRASARRACRGPVAAPAPAAARVAAPRLPCQHPSQTRREPSQQGRAPRGARRIRGRAPPGAPWPRRSARRSRAPLRPLARAGRGWTRARWGPRARARRRRRDSSTARPIAKSMVVATPRAWSSRPGKLIRSASASASSLAAAARRAGRGCTARRSAAARSSSAAASRPWPGPRPLEQRARLHHAVVATAQLGQEHECRVRRSPPRAPRRRPRAARDARHTSPASRWCSVARFFSARSPPAPARAEQLGGCGGRPARANAARRLVERRQRLGQDRSERPAARRFLQVVDDLAEPSVHRPAPSRRCVRQGALGKQRLGEANAHAGAARARPLLRLIEQGRHAGPERPGEQLHGGLGQRGDGQQQRLSSLPSAARRWPPSRAGSAAAPADRSSAYPPGSAREAPARRADCRRRSGDAGEHAAAGGAARLLAQQGRDGPAVERRQASYSASRRSLSWAIRIPRCRDAGRPPARRVRSAGRGRSRGPWRSSGRATAGRRRDHDGLVGRQRLEQGAHAAGHRLPAELRAGVWARSARIECLALGRGQVRHVGRVHVVEQIRERDVGQSCLRDRPAPDSTRMPCSPARSIVARRIVACLSRAALERDSAGPSSTCARSARFPQVGLDVEELGLVRRR